VTPSGSRLFHRKVDLLVKSEQNETSIALRILIVDVVEPGMQAGSVEVRIERKSQNEWYRPEFEVAVQRILII